MLHLLYKSEENSKHTWKVWAYLRKEWNLRPQLGCRWGERQWEPLSDGKEFFCGCRSGSHSAGLWTPGLWGSAGFPSRWPGWTVTPARTSQPAPDKTWWCVLTPATKRRSKGNRWDWTDAVSNYSYSPNKNWRVKVNLIPKMHFTNRHPISASHSNLWSGSIIQDPGCVNEPEAETTW